MSIRSFVPLPCLVTSSFAVAQVPQLTVVPAAYATTDAVSYLWIPGASRDVRQQTLVGSSHLVPMLGRTLTAIELRRSAANEVYQGGVSNMTVTLSTSPSQPLRCSGTFAANVGPDATVVFTGPVTLPTSPAVVGPAVAWTPANTVRIAFQQPFVYTGGTLCLDVVGLAVPGQNANWWMADAMFEDVGGFTAEVGNGCGQYGGAQGRWSFVSTRLLVPGGHASFWAYGVHTGLGIAAFGMRSQAPIPLTALGIPSPGCDLHLGSIDAMIPTLFEPPFDPRLDHRGGCGEVILWIPDSSALFGTTMTTQWFDWSQLAMSNAIEWTVAGAMPTLDMTAIDGDASQASGQVSVHLAHVLRFEHH